MVKEASFDIVSRLDLQQVDNAVNQANREVATRYDLKNTGSAIRLDKDAGEIHVASADDFHLRAVIDVLKSKLVQRKVSLKALRLAPVKPASGGTVRQVISLVQGIDQESVRALAKRVRDSKLKVRTQVEGDKLRVFSKSKDALQEVIKLIKEADLDIPLEFVNPRD